MSNQFYINVIVFIVAIGGILFGFDTGIIAGSLPFIIKTYNPSLFETEFIVSVLVLGAFLGSLSSGKLVNYFGRRKLLLYLSLMFIFGTIFCVFANSVLFIIVGRFILGLTIGATSYTVPLYISEISTSEKRGSFVIINSLFLTAAQAFSFIVAYFISNITHPSFLYRTRYYASR